MKFRLRNIKPGQAEFVGNARAGERYKRLALIVRDEGMWGYTTKDEFADEFGHLPCFTKQWRTRRECFEWLARWFLKRQAERAIEGGKGFSKIFWHCPCRDALSDMRESGLFSVAELREWREKMEVEK